MSVGETLRIDTQELTIAGFLRDSQMNSMMASSKRFLVREQDYAQLKALGDEELKGELRLGRYATGRGAFQARAADVGLAA